MVFSIFHFLKHQYYNCIFHISFFKALLLNEGETTRNEGELTPTAFRLVLSTGKLNLPLVQSQYYVLQDNKRWQPRQNCHIADSNHDNLYRNTNTDQTYMETNKSKIFIMPIKLYIYIFITIPDFLHLLVDNGIIRQIVSVHAGRIGKVIYTHSFKRI